MKDDASCAQRARRQFLRQSLLAAGVLAIGPRLVGRAFAAATDGGLEAWDYGPLLPANAHGLRLPAGFSSRIIARADEVIGRSGYAWHRAPDGGACFAAGDGGWVYASNSELGPGAGGVGAVRFDPQGNIVDAYRIADGTTRNCSGGPTPWGTWITCEETERGRAIECDPLGRRPQRELPALGWLYREAVAIDPRHGHVYHTEDRHDGRLYRSRHPDYPDLGTGVLEAAVMEPGDIHQPRRLRWIPVPHPNPDDSQPYTRLQVPEATVFDRGEGMWYHAGMVYFTTTADNRIWAIDCAAQTIQCIYDREATSPAGIATGVDNLCATADGNLLVAEDGGELRLVMVTPEGRAAPLLQVEHEGSELAGPAFSPDGTRLYFSSQRGPAVDGNYGVTFEVSGPFRGARAA
ncbi:alkaline phosphatase PhoX [Pseudofulvimonas gallinarii]|uniref:Uncharacterized protein DUF839 n=1 Tax=Pseudofulvimonas gallinarii TaxID=634155 RepID=A0A4S3KYR2_9GAMM|nr:alkaline phosphatase PhoX [Pseudofulvimonas gallinarii]TCS98897.1 uncharacterized protein DUF839 [Pseudofulvimonas gallinarii]THD14376.1 hypothetical protein B1808_03695 [Pseudofulvimonas gallinarii]